MGRFKPLLPFGGGTILTCVVETLHEAGCGPLFVVTGHRAEEIEAALANYPAVTVHNAGFAEGGMLSSVQTGVRALPEEAQAFFLALGDQPAVQPGTVRALAEAWQITRPFAALPVYNERRGHPVLFSRRAANAILALPEGATLKAVITQHSSQLLSVPVSDPAVLADVDTPEDYERALKMPGRRS